MTYLDTISLEDRELYAAAWDCTRANHGNTFTFYLPGMIRYGNRFGRYPAISLTGNLCELQCEHCRGKLLEPMLRVSTPGELIRAAEKAAEKGAQGILLTGGSDRRGMLPWKKYSMAIAEIYHETGLHMSAHCGFPDRKTCALLEKVGVSQALIDVMGDERTAKEVYHLKGLNQVLDSLGSIKQSKLELIPHIVAGLYYGKMRGEYKALEIIRSLKPAALVIVVLTPLKGTPMADVSPPNPFEIGRLIAKARLLMPAVTISLGCERPRNRQGWLLERLAIHAGVNRMAIWSEHAVKEAKDLGLSIRFQATCCSLDYRPEFGTSPD